MKDPWLDIPQHASEAAANSALSMHHDKFEQYGLWRFIAANPGCTKAAALASLSYPSASPRQRQRIDALIGLGHVRAERAGNRYKLYAVTR